MSTTALTARSALPFRHPLADMRAAHAAIRTLEAEYLKAHRKKHTIDLTMSSTSQPFLDERGRARMGRERVEVISVYDPKDASQTEQSRWMMEQARSLTL